MSRNSKCLPGICLKDLSNWKYNETWWLSVENLFPVCYADLVQHWQEALHNGSRPNWIYLTDLLNAAREFVCRYGSMHLRLGNWNKRICCIVVKFFFQFLFLIIQINPRESNDEGICLDIKSKRNPSRDFRRWSKWTEGTKIIKMENRILQQKVVESRCISDFYYLTANVQKCLCRRESMVKEPAVGFMQDTNMQLVMSFKDNFCLSYL